MKKRALVVGGSKHIGLAVTKTLRKTCSVVSVARTRSDDRGTYVLTDISREGEIGKLSSLIASPDIIVHVIGGSIGIIDPWAPSSEWAKVWNFNLGIAHDINRAFIPGMIKRGWGRIVHFSSVAVNCGIGYAPYASAKHAVEGYVKNMSKEVAKHGVIMTCVRLGSIPSETNYLGRVDAKTRQQYIDSYIAQGRAGTPEDVAGVVAFLCSEDAKYMPGSIVTVDGGHR